MTAIVLFVFMYYCCSIFYIKYTFFPLSSCVREIVVVNKTFPLNCMYFLPFYFLFPVISFLSLNALVFLAHNLLLICRDNQWFDAWNSELLYFITRFSVGIGMNDTRSTFTHICSQIWCGTGHTFISVSISVAHNTPNKYTICMQHSQYTLW